MRETPERGQGSENSQDHLDDNCDLEAEQMQARRMTNAISLQNIKHLHDDICTGTLEVGLTHGQVVLRVMQGVLTVTHMDWDDLAGLVDGRHWSPS